MLFRSAVWALRVQAQVVLALVMREVVTRYGRHNIGFLWLFLEPAMFTIGVLAVYVFSGNHQPRNLPLIPFTLVGYSSVLLWRNTINRCAEAIEPNRALLHHRRVRVIDIFLARIVLECAGVTIAFLTLLTVAISLNGASRPRDALDMLLGWISLAWWSGSMGILIGALVGLSETVHRVWHVLSYLMLPLSGAFFAVDWLPRAAQKTALWIPSVSCVELLREGLFGVQVHPHYSIGYVVLVNLILMLLGLSALRLVEHRIEGE